MHKLTATGAGSGEMTQSSTDNSRLNAPSLGVLVPAVSSYLTQRGYPSKAVGRINSFVDTPTSNVNDVNNVNVNNINDNIIIIVRIIILDI